MPRGRDSLVGRGRELDELRDGLQSALGERGGLFMVAGDPGVGKTALADEIGGEAVAAGALVLWVRAWEGGGAPAYWPWLRIVRRLAAARDIGAAARALGPEASGRLTALLPDLLPAATPGDGQANATGDGEADAPGDGKADPPGDSDSARFQVFDAVATLLRTAAADGPLVLLLDDLHCVDHPSLLLLEFLATHLRETPMLVVGTYRETEARLDDQLAATLGDIIRHGRRLALRGLNERDVAEMVERVAGRSPPEGVVRAIHRATEGNPFFVDEVVRLLSAEGRLDSEAQVAGLRLPDGVRETIRHRLQPLSDRARALLSTAAVVGREFRLDTLRRVCELEPAELDKALTEALEFGVIAERSPAIGLYGFSHGLVREALYDDLGPLRRGPLHRAVALALEQLYASDPEPHLSELAHHFFVAATAGELAKAIDYSVRAGRRAMSLIAYEAASEHFEHALQAHALSENSDPPLRCDLLLALARAQSRAGDSRRARESFLRAAGLARRLDAPEPLARAALGYGAGMGGFEFGLVDETLLDLLGEARAALGSADRPLLARVLGRMATELYYSDRADERERLSEQAVAMARRLGDRAALASALSARLLTLWGPENCAARLRIADDVVALGDEVHDRELLLRGHVWRILGLMELGDWVAVDIELATHARLADELRDPLHLWYTPLFEANRAMLDGRLADAERLAEQAYATGHGVQPQNAAQLYAVQILILRTQQGRLGELLQSLEEFARRYPATPVWRAAAAFAQAQTERTGEARRSFEELCAGGLADVPRDSEWLSTIALLIVTGMHLKDPRRTATLGALLEPYAELAVITGRGSTCLGPVSRFIGIAAMSAGRFDEAIAAFESALELAGRWGAAPQVAALRLELAEALTAAKVDLERARLLRSQGLQAARRLELHGLVERSELAGDGLAPVRAPAALALRSPGPASAGPAAFFRRGDVWTIVRGERPVVLPNAKGLAHIARLLAAPRVEFHALDLVAGAHDRGASAAAAAASGIELRRGSGDAGPVLDGQAKAAYKERVVDLQQEIEEAESFNDPERASHAREELAFLSRELAGAVGLGGRDRRSGSDAERARVNVTRAIRTALARVAEQDPALGRSLGKAIRTGTFCVYEPVPGDEPSWDLSGPG
ncbi:MAG: ATP-binding protein [Solirubrobacteraceae bacterium]